MNKEKTTRITLIGDIFPGELPFTRNYGIRSQFKNHNGLIWIRKIREIIGENDIVIGNLECPLVYKENISQNILYGNPEFALFLKESGINVLNIANNHILEHGKSGFQDTIQILNKADLGIVGHLSGSSSKILIKDINGCKIGIAGFSNVDLHVIKNENSFAVLNEENVINTLKSMEDNKIDIKILCFHWGNEYVYVPSLEQKKLAYTFIDNGADVIVGHHPHVIQPYEIYKHGHIFYSLGNFMFDYIHSKMFSIGLVVSIEISKSKNIKSNLKGVKISYKKTIDPISFPVFNKYYGKITQYYAKYSPLSAKEYNALYFSMLKRNHLYQKFLMKSSIINEFLRIKTKDKIYFIKNVLTYYFNLFKCFINK